MTWQDVQNLEELAQLNLQLALDALDEAIDYLNVCQEEFKKALEYKREVNNGMGID